MKKKIMILVLVCAILGCLVIPISAINPGTTNFSMNVQLFDDTTGAPKTGLTFSSTGVNISYARSGAARVAITEVTLASASAAYNSGGFVEIDATNMPGVYRFDVPNAALTWGVRMATINFVFTGVRNKAVNIDIAASLGEHIY